MEGDLVEVEGTLVDQEEKLRLDRRQTEKSVTAPCFIDHKNRPRHRLVPCLKVRI